MRRSIDQYNLGRPIGSHDNLHPSQSAATLTNPMDPLQSREDLSILHNNHRGANDHADRARDKVDDGHHGRSTTDEPNEFQSPKTAGEKTRKPENGEATRKDTPVTDVEAEQGNDPNLVTWYGPEDKENP